MTSIMVERDEAAVLPRWSGWRVAGACVAGFALLVVVAAAAGFIAAHLDHGTGARVWHDRLRWIVLAWPALLMVAGGVWLWRRSRRVERGLSGGEARAFRRSRGFWTVLGVQVVAGTLVGAFGGLYVLRPEAVPADAVSWAALAFAILTLVATAWGCFSLYPRIDELELQDNLWGGCAGASAIAILYPPWYILWRGGWVPEPAHEALFLLVVGTMMAVYLWRKSRR